MGSSEQYNAVFEGNCAKRLNEYQEENDATKAETLRHYVQQGVRAEREVLTDGGQRTVDLTQVTTISGIGAIVAFLLVLSGLGSTELIGAAVMLTIVSIGSAVTVGLQERKKEGFHVQ